MLAASQRAACRFSQAFRAKSARPTFSVLRGNVDMPMFRNIKTLPQFGMLRKSFSSSANDDFKALVALVDSTDFPRLTQQFLADADDLAEVAQGVLKAEDPSDALSAMVREHHDTDNIEAHFPEMQQQAIDIALADDEDEYGEVFEGTECLADDEELMAWAKKAFGDEFELDDEAEGNDEDPIGIEMVADDESDLDVADDEVSRDWRRLQKLISTQQDEQGGGTTQRSQAHPWFESRSLLPGADLPSIAEAGPDPLEAVFGISLDNPRPHASGKQRKLFYPGQEYAPKDLNPYNVADMDDSKVLAKRRFQQLMRQRSRKDPFTEGKMKRPAMNDISTLSRFVSERGKIIPRRRTGVTAKNQRHLKRMIKRARTFGLLPYTSRMQRPGFDNY